jgi:hypothetical protein
MEPEFKLPRTQEPASGPYSWPDKSSPCHTKLFLQDSSSYYPPTFPSGLPTNILYEFIFSPTDDRRPAYFILLDLIILIICGEENKLLSPVLCCFLQPPATSSHFGPKSLFSTLFSNTLSLCCSFNIREHVSAYRTTGKIMLLYTQMFTYLDTEEKIKFLRSNQELFWPHRITIKCLQNINRPAETLLQNFQNLRYNRLTNGGEVVSLTRRPPFTPQEDSWYSFLLEAESIPGPQCGWKD